MDKDSASFSWNYNANNGVQRNLKCPGDTYGSGYKSGSGSDRCRAIPNGTNSPKIVCDWDKLSCPVPGPNVFIPEGCPKYWYVFLNNKDDFNIDQTNLNLDKLMK